jgi:hypothetical protein
MSIESQIRRRVANRREEILICLASPRWGRIRSTMPTAAARPEAEPQPRVQPKVGYGLLAVCSA